MAQPHLAILTRKLLDSRIKQLFNFTNHLRSRTILGEQSIFRRMSSESKRDEQNMVSVSFLRPDGKKVTVKSGEGKSLYDAVIDNNVDIDGFGACEGTLCCTTCHLIFKQADYEKVGEPSDEELDMLDLAYGLTETSRLGCQVFLSKELDQLEVEVPASINDVRES